MAHEPYKLVHVYAEGQRPGRERMPERIRHLVGYAGCLLGFLPNVFPEVRRPEGCSGFGGDEQFTAVSCLEDIKPFSYRFGNRNLSDPVTGLRGVVFPSPDYGMLHLDMFRENIPLLQPCYFRIDHPGKHHQFHYRLIPWVNML